MKLTTTIVDDMDLGISPVNFRADPVKRTAVGRGVLGLVHFLWPIGERMKNLTIYYEHLERDQVRRLITALGHPSPYNRTIQFHPGGLTYFIPGKVNITVTMSRGYSMVTIETIARRFGVDSTTDLGLPKVREGEDGAAGAA